MQNEHENNNDVLSNLSNLKNYKTYRGSWLFSLIASLIVTVCLAPVAIWISIEKNEILYTARNLQNELDKKLELKAKLEVERGRLLSSQELERRAKEIGMGVAESGQIRRLDHVL